MVPVQYSGFAKKRREKNLKREIQALKRQMKLERKISGQSLTDETLTFSYFWPKQCSIPPPLTPRQLFWKILRI